MLRLINNSRVKDKISTASMLKKFDLLSVNQLAAQIKLQEVWKATHIERYGVVFDSYNTNLTSSGHDLRPKTNRKLNDTTRLVLAEHSFTIDAAKLWNAAPASITTAPTLGAAKTLIRKFVLTMPI